LRLAVFTRIPVQVHQHNYTRDVKRTPWARRGSGAYCVCTDLVLMLT
jgi:hypothetical protein